MDNLLKKILTGMVTLLIVLLAAGGYYSVRMGGMNHGTAQTAYNSEDKQNTDNNQHNNPEVSSENSTGSGQKADDTGQPGSGNQQKNTGQAGSEALGPAGAPVIIQIQPPKTDPGLYVQQLQEKLKSINEANSSIASNSGGHDSTAQQNGGSSTGNMNQLHQDFYKLGKDIASVEQNLSKLSESIRDNKFQVPQQYYSYPNNYPYVNPQYPGYLPYQPSQNQQNQQYQQNQQNQQNQAHQGNISDNSNHSNMSAGQANYGILPEGILNVNSMRTVFTLVLLGSVLLGIISVIGFLTSLFKPAASRSGINSNTIQ